VVGWWEGMWWVVGSGGDGASRRWGMGAVGVVVPLCDWNWGFSALGASDCSTGRQEQALSQWQAQQVLYSDVWCRVQGGCGVVGLMHCWLG
jgi:hypothetical protein